MAESAIQLPPDGTGKKLRTYDKGAPGHDQYVIPTSERKVSFRGKFASFLIPGSAATPQNLLSVENAVGSGVLVAVRELKVFTSMTAASAVRSPNLSVYRITTAPTGGTVATKASMDSGEASSASVTVRGGASADGTASAITATAAGARLHGAFANRLHTLAGVVNDQLPAELISQARDGQDLILRAGEFMLLQLAVAAAADNIATRFFLVDVEWDEFTLA